MAIHIPQKSTAISIFLAVLLLSFMGCSTVKTASSPGGDHSLECPRGMEACINTANKLCGDEGYVVLKGVSRKNLLGGASSSYREVTETAELSIRCGVEEVESVEGTYQLPPRTDEPLQPVVQPKPALQSILCTPGATQTCVGPGACAGGQVCLSGGQAFGACDCGGAVPSSAASKSTVSSGQDKSSSGSTPEGQEKQPIQVPGAAPAPQPLQTK